MKKIDLGGDRWRRTRNPRAWLRVGEQSDRGEWWEQKRRHWKRKTSFCDSEDERSPSLSFFFLRQLQSATARVWSKFELLPSQVLNPRQIIWPWDTKWREHFFLFPFLFPFLFYFYFWVVLGRSVINIENKKDHELVINIYENK